MSGRRRWGGGPRRRATSASRNCSYCDQPLWKLRWNHTLRCSRWAWTREKRFHFMVEAFITAGLIIFLLLVQWAG